MPQEPKSAHVVMVSLAIAHIKHNKTRKYEATNAVDIWTYVLFLFVDNAIYHVHGGVSRERSHREPHDTINFMIVDCFGCLVNEVNHHPFLKDQWLWSGRHQMLPGHDGAEEPQISLTVNAQLFVEHPNVGFSP